MPVNIYHKVVKILLDFNRSKKTILLILADYILLVLCFELSLSIRNNELYLPTTETAVLILLAPLLAIPIFYICGLYQSFVRFSGNSIIRILILGITIYSFFWFFVVLISKLVIKPYDFLVINWLVTLFFISGLRLIARKALTLKSYSHKNVLIYGAGSAAIQLTSVLHYSPDIRVIGFIDDDKNIQGKYISGIKVLKASDIESVIKKYDIAEVLLAIPSLSRKEKAILIDSIKGYGLIIRTIPSLSDLADGKFSISDLKKVRIEDLLNRQVVKPNDDLLNKDINGKNILVTGAGGSIGSELCRQIIKLEPKSLILFDISEVALYLIEQELREYKSGIRILAMIGNITRKNRLNFILKEYEIDTIYHAAAYKHVPLVEKNTIPGIRCNIFGTLTCIQAAIDNNVGSFVFISTDKAVRPTNIMGASKRFSEQILQVYAKQQSLNQDVSKTRISIVRFGNVLNSSGSVVPLFRRQIESGGPVTVTDPNIIRYFMTIEEASQLVIQAGAMGSEGEIFLLDMGEPVYILDLAKNMIRLSGMTIRDNENIDGDIEINFIGLRPGEKLREELLIGKESYKTKHEKIMKAHEEALGYEQINNYINQFEIAIETSDFKKIREIFLSTVSGYKPGKYYNN